MALTKKQKQVYDYIVDYIEENSVSPTQQEIKDHFSFKSLGSVQDYLRYLKQAGYIQNDPNSVRGLTPLLSANAEQMLSIPLHGEVAAGSPIEAIEGQEHIDVPASMIGKGVHFALNINGSSMIEDGILDGDIVIIKKQNTAHNGQTVVATIENEATIKRFYKKNKSIELHPANSALRPMIFDASANLEIKGILVGLLRKY